MKPESLSPLRSSSFSDSKGVKGSVQTCCIFSNNNHPQVSQQRPSPVPSLSDTPILWGASPAHRETTECSPLRLLLTHFGFFFLKEGTADDLQFPYERAWLNSHTKKPSSSSKSPELIQCSDAPSIHPVTYYTSLQFPIQSWEWSLINMTCTSSSLWVGKKASGKSWNISTDV